MEHEWKKEETGGRKLLQQFKIKVLKTSTRVMSVTGKNKGK